MTTSRSSDTKKNRVAVMQEELSSVCEAADVRQVRCVWSVCVTRHLTLSLPAQSADGRGCDGAVGNPPDGGSHLQLQDLLPLGSVRSAVRQRALHGIAQLNVTAQSGRRASVSAERIIHRQERDGCARIVPAAAQNTAPAELCTGCHPEPLSQPPTPRYICHTHTHIHSSNTRAEQWHIKK